MFNDVAQVKAFEKKTNTYNLQILIALVLIALDDRNVLIASLKDKSLY